MDLAEILYSFLNVYNHTDRQHQNNGYIMMSQYICEDMRITKSPNITVDKVFMGGECESQMQHHCYKASIT